MSDEIAYVNLYDLPATQGLEFDFQYYRHQEESVLTPALRQAGYSLVSRWYSAERDSFGPLIRSVEARDPDGNLVTLFYG